MSMITSFIFEEILELKVECKEHLDGSEEQKKCIQKQRLSNDFFQQMDEEMRLIFESFIEQLKGIEVQQFLENLEYLHRKKVEFDEVDNQLELTFNCLDI